MFYATNLALNGSADMQCVAGQICEIGLLITNGGSGTDNVSVQVLANDGFPVQLCRPDGVCGTGSLPILNIGASNTAFVTVRFTVPADAASQLVARPASKHAVMAPAAASCRRSWPSRSRFPR